MINATVRVAVRWLAPEEGGRRQPFAGQQYRPTAVVDGDDGRMWSATIEFDDALHPTSGRFRFLAAAAPTERLKADAHLELYEGPRLVAECRVAANVSVDAVAGVAR
jgi:hypothetical protein